MSPSKKKKSVAFRLSNEDFVLDPATICAKWTRLWSSFGFNPHQWNSRANKVEEYSQQLITNKISNYSEQIHQRKLLVKQSVDEYEDLAVRTGLNASLETKVFDELKLKEQEVYIEKKMQELIVNEGQLLHQRTELEREQKHLCSVLNATPLEFTQSEFSIEPPMSIVEINRKLDEQIQMLRDLKNHRFNQIVSYYAKIKDFVEQLDWRPTSTTIEHLLKENFDECLTADRLNEIETILHDLEIRIEKQKERYFVLHGQLTSLYQRLGKDPKKDSCLAYRTAGEHIDAMIIQHLEEEIEICREERLKNGDAYRQMIRQQIEDLIDKAHLNDDDRAKIHNLNEQKLTADLLDVYDAEYERICQLYEKRKPMLDAFEKWAEFWKEFVEFTKTSTDPARFRARGYNAQAEGRKRKKFLRELPIVEQEFRDVLSQYQNPVFFFDNVPIEEKFEEAHRQVPASALPSAATATARTVVAATPSPRVRTTPVRFRTLAVTPRREGMKDRPPISSATSNRLAKTPAVTPSRKLLGKVASRTEQQPKRAKPLPPPPSTTTAVAAAVEPLPVHPPARTDDQILDFSLLHTIKNAHGQIKIMTSTPNTSMIGTDQQDHLKTAFNPIERRRLRRRSHRSPNPTLIVQHVPDETVPCL